MQSSLRQWPTTWLLMVMLQQDTLSSLLMIAGWPQPGMKGEDCNLITRGFLKASRLWLTMLGYFHFLFLYFYKFYFNKTNTFFVDSCQGTQVWYIWGCRTFDLCRISWKWIPLSDGCTDFCRLGSRLLKVWRMQLLRESVQVRWV